MDLLFKNNQHFRLTHAKTQLNQAVKPYSINVVKRRGF